MDKLQTGGRFAPRKDVDVEQVKSFVVISRIAKRNKPDELFRRSQLFV